MDMEASTSKILRLLYDDLRPDLSAYDVPFMSTPNIQKLADTGLTYFTSTYCQEAVCSPSRNSFTTGKGAPTRPRCGISSTAFAMPSAECPVAKNLQRVRTSVCFKTVPCGRTQPRIVYKTYDPGPPLAEAKPSLVCLQLLVCCCRGPARKLFSCHP
jgi:hypothetical protein